ncbi:unnamed protein product [Cuscuta campestris]|uniref:Kinesin-like protein n=1 Tax=Cuscuta campestris TaxID=132261 RepID=A0A484M2E8_9ASTE|nr:unnamed protein product [Cuscuta campestris]
MKWENMEGGGNGGGEEKILVLVRLRPLSEKEISRNEVSDWECINETTILYRNSIQERSGLPTAYSFDGVFRGDCSTREVYEAGTKEIALSVVGGVNSTIFAYGQTSSGKTYTMNGITEYAVADIYDYIQKHEERAFVLKFSAIEIYNEVVRDLLSSDNSPLRLLDDPEKGTIVEKITEETLRDWSHLKELLSICEAQRQIGETHLNETSSRSHQILRLTIESSAREFIGKDKKATLSASVNFVDLAGSERASQALSVGQRLKEGCHINRSLLTLGTVIRKLSRGRQGHINYRDSKLTRILQPALGGNARTAIICNLSPARCHVEQSRNTLLFACCAKEVTTNAKVNVMMSDKALVKHLQREVARLETELRTPPGTCCDHLALLRKKDMQIEKLDKEIKELKKQRDLAQSRVKDLLQMNESDQDSSKTLECSSSKPIEDSTCEDECSENGVNSATSHHQQRNELTIGEKGEPGEDFKDFHCIETDKSPNNEKSPIVPVSGDDGQCTNDPVVASPTSHNKASLVRNSDKFALSSSSSSSVQDSRRVKMSGSRSCETNVISDLFGQCEPATGGWLEKDSMGRPEGFQRKQWNLHTVSSDASNAKLSRSDSPSSNSTAVIIEDVTSRSSVNVDDEGIPSVDTFVAGLKEMAKLHQVEEGEDNRSPRNVKEASDWGVEYERMQKRIIELWQTCNVSLIHRTYFFLLFKGDPTDSIYMEVEVRRLSFLEESFSKGNMVIQGGKTHSLSSSLRELCQERGMLRRLVHKRLTGEERNETYQKWGIALDSKQRRQNLARRIWSETGVNHARESAAVVAKLIGFSGEGEAALREMCGLNFTPPLMYRRRRSFGWRNTAASSFNHRTV